MKTICQIYHSPKREGMYLYVKKGEGLSRVPDSLLQQFGQPRPALVLALHPERRLARASARAVLDSLEEPGYYLQMPPGAEELDPGAAVAAHNSKLSGA